MLNYSCNSLLPDKVFWHLCKLFLVLFPLCSKGLFRFQTELKAENVVSLDQVTLSQSQQDNGQWMPVSTRFSHVY